MLNKCRLFLSQTIINCVLRVMFLGEKTPLQIAMVVCRSTILKRVSPKKNYSSDLLAWIYIRCHLMALDDNGWHWMTLDDIEWHWMTLDDSYQVWNLQHPAIDIIRWHHMTTDDIMCHQMLSDNSRWHHLTSDDIRRHQMTSNEIR